MSEKRSYLRRPDFPPCPACDREDCTESAGQWRDGLCWWWCINCDHRWETTREKDSQQ